MAYDCSLCLSCVEQARQGSASAAQVRITAERIRTVFGHSSKLRSGLPNWALGMARDIFLGLSPGRRWPLRLGNGWRQRRGVLIKLNRPTSRIDLRSFCCFRRCFTSCYKYQQQAAVAHVLLTFSDFFEPAITFAASLATME